MSLLPYVKFKVNDHNRKVMGDPPSFSGVLEQLESKLRSRNFERSTLKSYIYFAERFLYSIGKPPEIANQHDMDLFISSVHSPRGKIMASYALKSLFGLVLNPIYRGHYEQLRLDRVPTS